MTNLNKKINEFLYYSIISRYFSEFNLSEFNIYVFAESWPLKSNSKETIQRNWYFLYDW